MRNGKPDQPRTDWARLRAMPDEEIEREAARDLDNPATDDWSRAEIGLPTTKTPVNARFDSDVVDWFKAQGKGYQTRMNAVLRRYMDAHKKAG